MRTLILIMMWVAIFPVLAATNELPPLRDEMTSAQYAEMIDRPNHSFTPKSTVQRLSLGQVTSFIGGGALGAIIGNNLVGHIVGRYANTPDRISFLMMGTMFGAVFAGQWCDDGWWPC